MPLEITNRSDAECRVLQISGHILTHLLHQSWQKSALSVWVEHLCVQKEPASTALAESSVGDKNLLIFGVSTLWVSRCFESVSCPLMSPHW